MNRPPNERRAKPATATVFAEVSKVGFEHIGFNEAVVAEAIERGDDVTLLADRGHVARLTPGLECRIVHVPVQPVGGRFNSAGKYFLEMASAVRSLLYARRAGARLVFLSAAPSTLLFLALLAAGLRARFTVFIHNELEMVASPDNAAHHPTRAALLDRAFRLLRRSPAKLLCLSRSGTDFLSRHYPGLAVSYTPLPPNRDARRFSHTQPAPASQPTFALVGTLGEAAINANIRELCDLLDAHPARRRVRLEVVGGRALQADTRERLQTSRGIDCQFVPAASQDDYLRGIAQCDTALFLCSPRVYSVSASAVIVDVVSLRREVFSLPCRYSEDMAAEHPVRLFGSLNELALAIVDRVDAAAAVAQDGSAPHAAPQNH